MIYTYYLVAVVFIGLILLLRSKNLMHGAVYIFNILQIGFVIYLFQNLNYNKVDYFNYDSISVLFACILSVLSFISAVHYQVYEKKTRTNYCAPLASIMRFILALMPRLWGFI